MFLLKQKKVFALVFVVAKNKELANNSANT